MKKWIAVICAAALMLSVTGCGQTKEASVKQLVNEELSGEITVSCYDTMSYKDLLELAAKSFEAKNPGTKINVEAFGPMPEIKTMEDGDTSIIVMSTGDDPQERSEYISKINTELMSGEGADVLAMDILPYYKYVDGGQLENLQAYMDADDNFCMEDYRKNIMDALKFRGGQYVIPMDYCFEYIACDSSLFSEKEQQSLQQGTTFTYEQLMKAAEEPFERVNAESVEPKRMFGAFAYSTMLTSMFQEMFLQDYGDYIDIDNKKVNLTDGRFTKLLKSLKKYNDNNYLKQNSDSSGDSPDDVEITIEDFNEAKEEQFFYKVKSHFSFLTEALKEAGFKNVMGFGDMDAGNEDHDKTLGLLANENGDIHFNFSQAYGINANSDNKALSWSFVKYLMSEEIQSNLEFSSMGLPVNNAARLEKAKIDITGSSFDPEINQKGDQEGVLTESQQIALDSYVKKIEELSDELNYYPIQDDTIDQMVNNEVPHYFDGSKSAEEVAKTLQEKIELYLNE